MFEEDLFLYRSSCSVYSLEADGVLLGRRVVYEEGRRDSRRVQLSTKQQKLP